MKPLDALWWEDQPQSLSPHTAWLDFEGFGGRISVCPGRSSLKLTYESHSPTLAGPLYKQYP